MASVESRGNVADTATTRICGLDPKRLKRFALAAGVSGISIAGRCATIERGSGSVSVGKIGSKRVARVCAQARSGARTCETFEIDAGARGLGEIIPNAAKMTVVEVVGEALVVLGVMLVARAVWTAANQPET